MKPRILIVDDEDSIRDGLSNLLVYHGYEVTGALSGEAALRHLHDSQFDGVILDLMLPGIDGYTVCRHVRETDKEIPIIMLTAKATEDEIVDGFVCGADDYVTKPFSLRQLLARLDAILRRGPWRELKNGTLTLSKSVSISIPELAIETGRERLPVTRREIELLLYLKRYETRSVSRDELLREVWGYSRASSIETRTVDIHIAKLRKKIESDPKAPRIIQTVRNEGYRLVTSV